MKSLFNFTVEMVPFIALSFRSYFHFTIMTNYRSTSFHTLFSFNSVNN